ncbi:MAG: hypothetical protein BRD30_06420 [Bacteroidetes bacterium QH_2_63_10]|nr:MAG: hypothetical protein BRD30_06420 [Bacteroidetes bacterium QH_2_63_10]
MQTWLSDRLDTARTRWAQFQDSRVGQRLLTGVRWLFMLGVLSYLAYQFTDIGWGRVWRALPTTPWFYVLLLLMYVNLPIAEVAIYGRAWNASARGLLPVLLRKRVLNNDVLGYSGEAYFSLWAQRNTNLGYRAAFETIKDNTIISSVASTSVAFLLLAVFFLSGQIKLLTRFLPDESSTVAAGIALLICAVAVGVAFRRTIFTLSPSLLLWIGGAHLVRFLANAGLQVAQWAVVIPEVSVGSWITLLALHIVINRIPFVPTRNLVFMGAGLELSSALQIPEAALGSMLLAQTLLDRVLNFSTYVGTSALDAATVEDREELEDLSLPDERA